MQYCKWQDFLHAKEILAPKLESSAARLCNPMTSSYFHRYHLQNCMDQFTSLSINESVWLHIDFLGSSQGQVRVLQEDRLEGEADQAADNW